MGKRRASRSKETSSTLDLHVKMALGAEISFQPERAPAIWIKGVKLSFAHAGSCVNRYPSFLVSVQQLFQFQWIIGGDEIDPHLDEIVTIGRRVHRPYIRRESKRLGNLYPATV